jgi:SOS-response transcriptional repressor LexA
MRIGSPVAAPARYSLLQAALPGGDLTPIGVLLEDQAANTVHLRLRRDWEQLASAEDVEVLAALSGDLTGKVSEMGTEEFFRHLEDSLSNLIRITDREAVAVEDFDRTLNRLYREHVQSNVVPFRTHLPRYSLRVAAGKFLENDEVTEDGWIEAPEDVRLSQGMFVAQIEGHSMEPYIPDGALCVFRAGVTGSRQGRLVLVENLETTGTNRYTVKRYQSEKDKSPGDDSAEAWRHTRIHLESLNPDYPSWDLDPNEDKYRIIAEFVRVLE